MSTGRYTSAIVKFYARVPGQKDKNRNFVFLSGCLQLKNMVPGGVDVEVNFQNIILTKLEMPL